MPSIWGFRVAVVGLVGLQQQRVSLDEAGGGLGGEFRSCRGRDG